MISNQVLGLSGELPDLLRLLRGAFRQERSLPDAVCDPSDEFIVWATNYLTKHRPTEIFAVDNNVGVMLTNGQRLCLCPVSGAANGRTGDMASPDSSIQIMAQR